MWQGSHAAKTHKMIFMGWRRQSRRVFLRASDQGDCMEGVSHKELGHMARLETSKFQSISLYERGVTWEGVLALPNTSIQPATPMLVAQGLRWSGRCPSSFSAVSTGAAIAGQSTLLLPSKGQWQRRKIDDIVPAQGTVLSQLTKPSQL